MSEITIVTTKVDHSALLLTKFPEVKKVNICFYENLSIKNLQSYFNQESQIILRDPYNTGENFEDLMQEIVKNFPKNIIFDYKALSIYPNYEDKLFQAQFFNKLNLKTPQTLHFKSLTELNKTKIEFPLIMKKRISSRNKGNFIISDKTSINRHLGNNTVDSFIFQEIINFEKDIRVIMLRNKAIAAIEREVIKNNDKFKVKVKSQLFKLPTEISKQCSILGQTLGADLLGIDLLKFGSEFYFIEANLSPQFKRVQELGGINIAAKILETL